ncbi:MAG TPA: wax ester/triacylglycerol synthase family O-acyltransferase [Solirubrobacterales bacterium]|nr:wax ester/triacylglycerol synthase family O-acyltransferase [Solirubrobacterales bacterium]
MPATRHTMPAADAAWLHMDSATNPMVVNGLVRLGGTPTLEAVRAVIETRMVDQYPRFRQRVADPLGRTPAFEDDPSFEIGNHLHRIALPDPGDEGALRETIADLISPPLDPNKPLWHLYLIEAADGTAAALWRIHHSIADGIALGQVMLATADGGPAPEPPAPTAEHHRGLLGRVAAVPGEAAASARSLAGAAVHETSASLANPAHLRELGSGALREVATAAKLIGNPADPATVLRRPLSGARRVAWSDPFPLQRVKDAGHRQRVTVNDLLLTALAATLAEAVPWDERPEFLHSMIPVNLRPLDQPVPAELGNDFALVLLELPLAELRPVERLRQVNSAINKIKDSPEALLSFGLLGAMGMAPRWVEDRLISFFTEKASMVVTDVPGPREPLSFAGVPIVGVLVWAPCSGSIGMTVSIFSYAGEVTTGFMTDTGLIPDPEPLARRYQEELDRLC